MLIRTMFLLFVVACAHPKKKDDEGSQYFNGVLNNPEVQTCHHQGHFFEFDGTSGTCGDIALASWPCTEQGLMAEVKTADARADAQKQLDRILRTENFEMIQCGEKLDRAYVTFSKRQSSDHEADLQIIHADFALGTKP